MKLEDYTFTEYQVQANKTLPADGGDLATLALGVAEELGDVLWYLTAMCSLLGVELPDVAAHNILKLQQVYADEPKDS